MKEIFIDSNIKNGLPPISDKKKSQEKSGASFGNMLKNYLQDVNKLQKEADKTIQNLAVGNEKNIHETMIAIEKADISFRLMMQIREKIIKAYEEIIRMPL
jgi:flagellar hook-basal body complex protein FliE